MGGNLVYHNITFVRPPPLTVRFFFNKIYFFVYFRFVDALLEPEIRTQFLFMPTPEMQQINMTSVLDKYKLPNIVAGVDGCHIPFLERPRNLPNGRDHVVFINRKGLYSLNAQIIGGFDRYL